MLQRNISDSFKCEQALKRTAFVEFKMVAQDAVKIRRDLRVSLAYLVSGFGNFWHNLFFVSRLHKPSF